MQQTGASAVRRIENDSAQAWRRRKQRMLTDRKAISGSAAPFPSVKGIGRADARSIKDRESNS